MTVAGGRRAAGPASWVSRSLSWSRRAARWIVAALPDPRRTPLTFGYLMLLLATTLVQDALPDATVDRVLAASSTNLDNLARRPLVVLLVSAVWLSGRAWVLYAVAFTAVLAPLERRLGVLRTLGIVLAGHVLVSVVTELGVAAGIWLGALPGSAAQRMDVGASYLLVTGLGAAIGLLPARARRPVLGVAGVAFALPLLLDGLEMTNIGHLLCLGVGAVSWPLLRRWRVLGTLLRPAVTAPAAARVPR
jgi:rhomboid family protein